MKPSSCLLLVLAWTAAAAPDGRTPYDVETVAGSGRMGDGGTALMAQMGAIQGIAVDRLGNLYLADTDHHRVRKVSAAGVITTLAGTGNAGFSGDGGPAGSAQLNLPYGVAVDTAGVVYVADLGNHRVRRIDTSGVIRTVAGTGTKGSSGDGGPATAAQLASPRNLVFDALGNLYIGEFEGHRIRKLSVDGKIVTVAGTGVAGFGGDGGPATGAQLNCPAGLAVDRFGALYVADSQNGRIRKFTVGGTIATVAGASGGLSTPRAVAVDQSGTFYVADSTGTWVDAYTTAGAWTAFAGGSTRAFLGDGGPANAASLTNVLDLAIDPNGNVFLADDVRVRRVDLQGNIQTVAGDGYLRAVGDGAAATDASLHQPSAVALDAGGNLWIADTGTQRVRQVLPNRTMTTVAGVGVPIWGATQDQVAAVTSGLNFPMGVAVDPSGNLFIADTYNHVVRRIGRDGVITTVAGTGEGGLGADYLPPTLTALRAPRAICIDRGGTLFVVDSSNHRILRLAPGALSETLAGNGSPGDSGDGGPARLAQFNQPGACAVDSMGNVFVADTLNHRIRKVNPAGIITTVAGTGEPGFSGDEDPALDARLLAPQGVASDDSGNLYIADTGNHRIRQVTPDGTIFTIAGKDGSGFQGDGGAATGALLNSPEGLFLDGAGTLYFADTGNDRVRRLVPGSAAIPDPVIDAPGLSAVNAASMQAGPAAPGEILALKGSGLGPEVAVSSTFDSGLLPVQLGGSEVRFDGRAAPLFYAQSAQVNVQAPYEIAGRSSTHVEVWYLGRPVGSTDLQVAAAAPALYPVVLNADGSANSLAHPATAGSTITIYATGEGLTDGPNISGQTARSPYPHPKLKVSLTIAHLAAPIVTAAEASGVVGILQITARVPYGYVAGQAAVQLTIGTAAAPDVPIWLK